LSRSPPDPLSRPCAAFDGFRIIASGALIDAALAAKAALAKNPAATILVFDDATGVVIDLDLRGATAGIVARLAAPAARAAQPASPRQLASGDESAPPRGPGRPSLGVVAREVTLLPRHWEWLAAQRGGASNALRRLVEEARLADGNRGRLRAAQEAAYRFMSAMAGDLPGFEEAARALFAADPERFAQHVAAWPADVRAYAQKLAWGGTADESEQTNGEAKQ
jgi:uncharacterized protein